MRIKPEELGRTEKYWGEDMYTHVIFTEKIIDLALRAKIETTTSLGLFILRDNLPEILQDKIPEIGHHLRTQSKLLNWDILGKESGGLRREWQKQKEYRHNLAHWNNAQTAT